MIYRAIVEEIIDPYTAKVRIPIIHRATMSNTHTSSESLPLAKICTLPNTYPNLQEGDVVIVACENNDTTRPIILGHLFIDTMGTTAMSPKFKSLEVELETKLSSETSIGDIGPEVIAYLKGVNENLQQQLNRITNRLTELELRCGILSSETQEE